MISIVVGGDICPIGNIQKFFIEGNAQEIFNDLLNEIIAADLSITNLECPLISQKTPILKAGPILDADINSIYGFVASNWHILNLANNHSFDHGARGLLETMHTIKEAQINYVGAGENIEEAKKPLIVEIKGRRIVIYSMAEREFSIADESSPGANPLDLINFVNTIKQYKKDSFFITLIHGGSEYYSYPSPEMVRRCRFMVDMGADAVICCHTHCPLPWEIYSDRPIIYGLGNLIFEAKHKTDASWHEGYLAKLTIEDRNLQLEVIPYIQSLKQIGVRKMIDQELEIFWNAMMKKNRDIKNSNFIKNEWLKHCHKQKEIFMQELFGYNRLMTKLSGLLLTRLHSKKDILRALHLVQCETHQEILNTLFKSERENI